MTHTPPVPAANQSPYPLQEPPHPKPSGPPANVPVARTPEEETVPVPPLIALAAAIGVAAVAGGLFYALAGKAKPKPKAKKRKAKRASA